MTLRGKAAVLAAATFALGGAFARAADEAPEPAVEAVPAAPVAEESQWEKFKAAARLAGEAVVQGTKNTAEKVADGAERAGEAVVDGSKRAGHAVAGTYEEAKEYVKEKIE